MLYAIKRKDVYTKGNLAPEKYNSPIAFLESSYGYTYFQKFLEDLF